MQYNNKCKNLRWVLNKQILLCLYCKTNKQTNNKQTKHNSYGRLAIRAKSVILLKHCINK